MRGGYACSLAKLPHQRHLGHASLIRHSATSLRSQLGDLRVSTRPEEESPEDLQHLAGIDGEMFGKSRYNGMSELDFPIVSMMRKQTRGELENMFVERPSSVKRGFWVSHSLSSRTMCLVIYAC